MAGAIIGALRVVLGIDTAQFEAGSKRAEDRAYALGERIGKSMRGAILSTYAQTDAGRAACLPADRVRGIDALDAELFAIGTAGAGGGDEALYGNAGPPSG